MRGVEDELQTDEAEGMHAQQERNEHEAARMDKRGEFVCSRLLTLFSSAGKFVPLTHLLCVSHLLGLGSPESDGNDASHNKRLSAEAPTCTYEG